MSTLLRNYFSRSVAQAPKRRKMAFLSGWRHMGRFIESDTILIDKEGDSHENDRGTITRLSN